MYYYNEIFLFSNLNIISIVNKIDFYFINNKFYICVFYFVCYICYIFKILFTLLLVKKNITHWIIFSKLLMLIYSSSFNLDAHQLVLLYDPIHLKVIILVTSQVNMDQHQNLIIDRWYQLMICQNYLLALIVSINFCCNNNILKILLLEIYLVSEKNVTLVKQLIKLTTTPLNCFL